MSKKRLSLNPLAGFAALKHRPKPPPASPQQVVQPEVIPGLQLQPIRASGSAKALRVGAAVVLVGLAAVGVRAAMHPSVTKIVNLPAAAAPQSAAAAPAVALRYVTTYYTTRGYVATDAQRGERIKMLAWDAPGVAAAGWSGQGEFTLTAAAVTQVREVSATARVVVVTGLLNSYVTDKATKKVGTTARFVAVEVPLQITSDGAAYVTDEPTLIGSPKLAAAATPVAGAADAALTATTREQATSFFKVFGQQADMAAVSAPGARISGLGGALTYQALAEWTVYEAMPGATAREARARVTWAVPGVAGAAFTSTYAVTLKTVTVDSVSNYQIQAVGAAN